MRRYRVVEIWHWDSLATRLPRDAFHMLDCLLDAKKQYPDLAADVQLLEREATLLDPITELAKLRGRLA